MGEDQSSPMMSPQPVYPNPVSPYEDVVDPGQSHAAEVLRHIDARLDDDPDFTLAHLSREQQGRVSIQFSGANHNAQNESAIGAAIGPVDYYVFEAPAALGGDSHPNARLRLDRTMNALAQGVDVPPDESNLVNLARNARLLWGPMITIRERQWQLPTIRSIDVDQTDNPPDPRYQTYDEQRAAIAQMHSAIDESVFLEPSESQREALLDLVGTSASAYAAREQVMFDQLSVIIANAVRRSPEEQNIVISVVTGATHTDVLRRLTEGTVISTELKYVPPEIESVVHSGVYGLTRAAVMDRARTFSEGELNRVLLGMTMIRLATDGLRGRGVRIADMPSAAIYNIVQDYVGAVPDDDIMRITADLDRIKNQASSQPNHTLRNEQNREAIFGYLSDRDGAGVQKLYGDIIALTTNPNA